MIKSFYCLAEAELSDPAAFLNLVAREGITLGEIESVDACRLRFPAPASALPTLEELAEQCGGSLRILRRGARARLRDKAHRHGLFLSLGALLGSLLLLSSLFLWEIELKDCPDTVARWQIMGALEKAGLRRGAFVPALSTELLCSKALETLPELGSLRVNIRGSRAMVEAAERLSPPAIRIEAGRSEVVADRQAVLTDVRVYAGTALVNKGMAVEKGEVLVRPSSTANRAEAEIRGLCRLEKTALLPRSTATVSETGKTTARWGLQWGKRCIFLQTDSSISPMVCGKIYSVSSRALPFGLCRLRLRETDCTKAEQACDSAYAEKLLERLLAKELGKSGELCIADINRSGDAVTLRCECEIPIGAERAME